LEVLGPVVVEARPRAPGAPGPLQLMGDRPAPGTPAPTPTGAPATGAPGPLAGIRVIDCSTVIAGPSCARYFADFGADVIKVERPPDGDSTRRMGVPDPADGVSLSWKLFNRNKRTIVLDLK